MTTDVEVALLDKDHGCASTGHTSSTAVMFNIITCGLGAGILSIPWTAAGASVTTAILILLVVLGLNYWTIMILIEGGEKHQVFDLGALLRKVPKVGIIADWYMNVMIWMSNLMCLVGYVIIIADNMSKVLAGGPFDSRFLYVSVGSVIAFCLCFLSQDALAFSSTFAILVNIYLFMVVCYFGISSPAKLTSMLPGDPWVGPVCYLAFSKGGVAMFSALMMGLIIQMCVLPFYQELQDRSVAKFRTILKKAFVFLFFLFAGFLYMSLLAFGEGVFSNVLENFPDGLLGSMAQIGMVGVALSVYPLMLMPMVAPIKTQYGAKISGMTTLGIVVLTAVISYFVTSLGFVVVLNGAVSVSGFVALAPAVVGLYLVNANKIAMYGLMFLGCLMTILGVFFTSNYVEDLRRSCLWSGAGAWAG